MVEKGGYVRDILALAPGAEATARGWVKTRTEFPAHYFVKVSDGSSFADLQLLVEKDAIDEATMAQVTTGACVEASGVIVPSAGKEQPTDLKVSRLAVHGAADPATYYLQKKRMNLETLREIAHFRTRTNTFGAVFRVRNRLAFAVHEFFQSRGFMLVHSPIITASDAEGAGQMFQVTTFDIGAPPRDGGGEVDFGQDFFGRPSHLTVSGQLEAEIFALAFTNVYTFGPTFRAENSNTARHLAEFWMIEPEMAFCDLDGDKALAEDFLKFIIEAVMRDCQRDLEFFQQFYDKQLIPTLENVVANRFEQITYTEAVELITGAKKKWEYPVRWGTDLQSEHERFLTEEVFRKPVVVTGYPKEIKAFYMRENDDGRTVRAMDVLAPRIGEIIGGSQREDRLEVLERKVAEQCATHGTDPEAYRWYLELRKYGGVEHSGFGLGFERMMMYLTGMSNIRDVIPFPRYPGHADF
ncbi:MAG: asparagine--tRNA ligase [Bryobacteraceae bacterium]